MVLSSLIPGWHSIEGRVLVQELGFTTTKADQLFLNNISLIAKIDIQGQQTLPLTGRFTSENVDFKPYNGSLLIDLVSPDSRWSMRPQDLKQSDLVVEELRLGKAIRVKALGYNPFNDHRLSFALQSAAKGSGVAVGNLKLNIGQEPIRLRLEQYEIPALNLAGDALELEFVPAISDLPPLEIVGETGMSLNLPDPQTYDAETWFWGNMAVRDVTFEASRLAANVSDTRQVSTISNGTVVMAGQSVDLKENQFLILQGRGIQSITDLVVKAPDRGSAGSADKEGSDLASEAFGIDVRFSGGTKQVKVGIDPALPIQTVESNWLMQIFRSNDVVVGIISFCGAILIACLSWLLENLFNDA